ncbi:UNVERIFIED_CONTAM: hypothetical protein Sindi_2543600 [Sesamum indicum]
MRWRKLRKPCTDGRGYFCRRGSGGGEVLVNGGLRRETGFRERQRRWRRLRRRVSVTRTWWVSWFREEERRRDGGGELLVSGSGELLVSGSGGLREQMGRVSGTRNLGERWCDGNWWAERRRTSSGDSGDCGGDDFLADLLKENNCGQKFELGKKDDANSLRSATKRGHA